MRRRRKVIRPTSSSGMWCCVGEGLGRSLGVGLHHSRGWGVDACNGRRS
jgi:hypothetical protein